jgi:hypothetical protein
LKIIASAVLFERNPPPRRHRDFVRVLRRADRQGGASPGAPLRPRRAGAGYDDNTDAASTGNDVSFSLHQPSLRRDRPDEGDFEFECGLRKSLGQHRLDSKTHAAVEQGWGWGSCSREGTGRSRSSGRGTLSSRCCTRSWGSSSSRRRSRCWASRPSSPTTCFGSAGWWERAATH